MELFIQLSDYVYISIKKLTHMTSCVIQGHIYTYTYVYTHNNIYKYTHTQ